MSHTIRSKKFYLVGLTFLAILVLATLRCGDSREGATFDPQQGHPSGWIATHGGVFVSDAEQCLECHGINLNGGISRVGCFAASFDSASCHGALAFHGAGWDDPDVHGPNAKAAPDTVTGFASCQVCHGDVFTGGIIQISCFAVGCHASVGGVVVPHSPAPWRGTPPERTHTDTDPLNAPVCGVCHRGQSGVTVPPGTPVDCFNNTLCHGFVGHPPGWADPDAHGAAAKLGPNGLTGFASCQDCHGADFAGGSAISCGICHQIGGVAIPHPPAPWRDAVPASTHTNTNTLNAPVCGDCHLGQSGVTVPPGTPIDCFNNTLCHGSVSHPPGWTTDHALAARVDISSCGVASCHGTVFGGGASNVSCYVCHLGGPNPGAGIMHPNRWPDPEQEHKEYLKNLNKDARSCSPTRSGVAQYCHGDGLPNDITSVIAPPNGSWNLDPDGDPTCWDCHGKEWNQP